MTLPALIMGIVISTIYGVIFHLWKGGSAGRLLLYLILGWLGFWVGHTIGDRLDWSFQRVGPLNLGLASGLSILLLFLGDWLTKIETPENDNG